MMSIAARIADELQIKEQQVSAAVGLLDEGSTVPFITRYRKEVTGGLDDSQMRQLEERLGYLRDLEQRREVVLKSIADQGKLTDVLEADIRSAETKTQLEDLYLPYKPKRRTKGQIAREAGLEPLADALLADPTLDPAQEAARYMVGGDAWVESEESQKIIDLKSALDGAKFILMERFSEASALLGRLRDMMQKDGVLVTRILEGKEDEGAKFRDYFEFSEPLSKVPSHRALAIFRGRTEGFLSVEVKLEDELAEGAQKSAGHPCEAIVAQFWQVSNAGRPADTWLNEVVRWTWKIKLLPHLETDLLTELRERAEAGAIGVFASNLKDLLLAAPAGQKITMGIDPGLRTGCKVAVVDATGKLLEHTVIYPTVAKGRVQEAEAVVAQLCRKYNVQLIAIGNGTASRETDRFVADVLKANADINAQRVMVSEAGASVYSASEVAAREFPDLDATIRSAVSIARRLQDPLAELVKIEPKAIGVGQYQHDVSQTQLAKTLDAVLEDCVNAVGVEVNSASVPLLAAVSGLNQSIASNLVEMRDRDGVFRSREDLKKVPRLGAKAFEQAAGFLRIANGDNPLDASAVHPESYDVVQEIAQRSGREVKGFIGDTYFLKSLKPTDFVNDRFGLPTVTDILSELDKPGRDPRPEFRNAQFKDGVETLADLKPGMILEGAVTNVTNFGAFVDIGVHQDGLVHISALSDKFVKDPREVVKAGDIVKVKVLEVDAARKRIALTMRLSDELPAAGASGQAQSGRPPRAGAGRANGNGGGRGRNNQQPAAAPTMAALFAEAGKKRNKGKRL